jgi:acetylornithine deacetylase
VTGFDPVDFLERAVATPSHEEVKAMRTLLVDELDKHGIGATVDDAGNVLATRDSGVDDAHVVLNTHLDTVPPHVPFEREGDVIRGRGACDAKGSLATLLGAFLAVEPDRGRTTLAITPDEERLSIGADALDLGADATIVGEPTGLDVCNAAKGRFQATITLRGVAAHASVPREGVNAIGAARDALDALETFLERPDALEAHPELGGPTLTPTTIEGGEATNQVPAECRIVVDRRSVPPETSEGFREDLEVHLRGAVPDDVDVEVALTDRPTPFLEAWETPAGDPLVETLRDASGGTVRPFTAATEASYFAADAPTVVFGPGDLADGEGAVAHADREYVRVGEIRAGVRAVEETLASFVG